MSTLKKIFLTCSIIVAQGFAVNETFTDSRDGKTYKTITIGKQTWMAENLNYQVEDSWCYKDNPEMCKKYGRLYTWAAAMGLPSSFNSAFGKSKITKNHQGACPAGWHIPTNAEWEELSVAVGGKRKEACCDGRCGWYEETGRSLKASKSWTNNGNGNDKFGFCALPAGGKNSGEYDMEGSIAYFRTTTEIEDDNQSVYVWNLDAKESTFSFNYTWFKDDGVSVRCLKN